MRRNRALMLAGWCCSRCPSRRDLQVHHRTYERLGCEWDQDLEVVCKTCHENEHIARIEASPYRRFMLLAQDAVRAHPFASFPDLSADVKTACARLKIPYDSDQTGRALSLVCGRRATPLIVVPRRPFVPFTEPIDRLEAHELCRRLGVIDVLKPMPALWRPRLPEAV